MSRPPERNHQQFGNDADEAEELGGAMTHNARSGVAHFAVDDEVSCLQEIRRLLAYLPSNNVDDPPRLRELLHVPAID